MRLAVSNIGWSATEDAAILPRLGQAGAEAIEVAPGRLFAAPDKAAAGAARAVAAHHRDAGLPIVSMQALLFGQPDLRLFGTAAETEAFLTYLDRIIALAGALGCGPLVFGSPKNRLRGEMSFGDARDAARPTLRRIGDLAQAAGTTFCLEANATAYGCDFMTRLAEAADVARAADHPRIAQVVDTGNMMMADEPAGAIAGVIDRMAHLHVSAPHLGPVGDHPAFVADTIGLARDLGYDGIVTLEMRPGDGPDPAAGLLRATDLLRRLIDARR